MSFHAKPIAIIADKRIIEMVLYYKKFERKKKIMLKRVIGVKRAFLSVGLIMMVSLLGCGNGLAGQDNTGTAGYEEELSEHQKTGHSEQVNTDSTSNNTETAASVKKDTVNTVGSETKKPTIQSGPASQPQAKTSVTLTGKGKAFLTLMCNELNDFNSGTTMDEKFWRDFLFNSYTGATSENAATEQVYREDLGFKETVIKVSLQEAQEHAKLVFGVELPDLKPSFEDMEKGQTAFYYKDGYYYIGVSGLPDYQYTFSECVADKENSTNTIVKYTVDFMGESNVGTVTFSISPENNANGFVICSKTTKFVK